MQPAQFYGGSLRLNLLDRGSSEFSEVSFLVGQLAFVALKEASQIEYAPVLAVI